MGRWEAPVFPEFTIPDGMSGISFRAMGASIWLLLPDTHARAGADAVRDLFAEWEQRLSRFLPESELSRLNERAGEPVQVSGLLFTVLTSALVAAQATGGLYDPTMQRQIVALGYDRTFEELPKVSSFHRDTPAATLSVTPGGGWRHIHLDRSDRRVTLPPGVGLDFGGIAKGMAVDASIARLRNMGVASALVSAGGDLAVLGHLPHGDAWPIAVSGRETGWELLLRSGALATSGIARRRWLRDGHEQHHLLDPRTGASAESDLWSVSVVADRCEQAEVAAKVAFLLGMERGAAFLRSHQLAGLLVAADGAWRTVDPWPSDLAQLPIPAITQEVSA
jgi:thiamine biosynthesis lipoprotein